MSIPLILVGLALSAAALLVCIERFQLPGSVVWRAARSRERQREAMRARSAAQLREAVAAGIAFGRFEALPAGRALLALGPAITERELADGLTSLFAECRIADHEDDRGGGPGSRVYDFYDGGLGMILEVASERVS